MIKFLAKLLGTYCDHNRIVFQFSEKQMAGIARKLMMLDGIGKEVHLKMKAKELNESDVKIIFRLSNGNGKLTEPNY